MRRGSDSAMVVNRVFIWWVRFWFNLGYFFRLRKSSVRMVMPSVSSFSRRGMRTLRVVPICWRISLAVAFCTSVRWVMTACLADSYCEVSRSALGSSSMTFPLRIRKVRACWASGVSASSTLGGGVRPEDLRVDRILFAVGMRCCGSSRECSELAIPSLILLKLLAVICFKMCSESDG